MLIEIAIGDAYGAGFEYADRDLIDKHNDLSRYIQHPRHKGIKPGMYTDDAQMSLAIAEALVEGDDWTPLNLANRFVDAFKRDPREGYAGRFYDFLQRINRGEEFLDKIIPTSDKSGAAMRAAPIGVCTTVEEVIERTTIQAKLTHNTPDGVNAAVAAALASHYFLYDLGDKADLGTFLETHVDGAWATPWRGKVKSKGWMSVRAAMTAITAHEALSDILRACIAFTGDVDTIAAIAMGAAAHSREVDGDLPRHLYATLENGDYGHDYITALDERLLALVDRG
ncbi:MAG: ADP-ribosylglycohydrolase family protein [Chloroflexota bacterium]